MKLDVANTSVTRPVDSGLVTVIGRNLTINAKRFDDDSIEIASGTGILLDKLQMDPDITELEFVGSSADSACFFSEWKVELP